MDVKRRLNKLEQSTGQDTEYIVRLSWGHQEPLELKPGDKVIQLTWGEEDTWKEAKDD